MFYLTMHSTHLVIWRRNGQDEPCNLSTYSGGIPELKFNDININSLNGRDIFLMTKNCNGSTLGGHVLH